MLRSVKPHNLSVYFREGAIFVVPYIPSAQGLSALDVVVRVFGGYAGLAEYTSLGGTLTVFALPNE